MFSLIIVACSPGQFGYNCAEICTGCLDEDCEPFSGNCTKDGCRNGYTGYRCQLRGKNLCKSLDSIGVLQ